MIKVAHLAESVSRKGGGLFDAVLRLAQSGDRRQCDERAFGLRDEFTEADLTQWTPVPAAAFAPAGLLKKIGGSPEFAAALVAFAPDVCHTHGLWLYPSVAASRYHRQSRQPYMISPHGMLDPWAINNSRWKKCIAWALFERAHLQNARCLRALCSSEADSIRRLGLKNDIVIIPNGIDLPEMETLKWGKQKTEISEAPWADFIGPDNKVLLFLSRIHPKKGLVNLLKAWAAGRASPVTRHSEWTLAIAGWDQGGHEAELKQLCIELQMPFTDLREPATRHPSPATILFLGPQFNDAKRACYQHCDAFVLPSFSEGLPMVALEAWAHSKPVLMTPECNLPEGFQAGAAVKIEATVAGVTGGLNELVRMTEADRAAMGGRARKLVEARFTWSHIAQQTGEVYGWMLGGGARPDCVFSRAC